MVLWDFKFINFTFPFFVEHVVEVVVAAVWAGCLLLFSEPILEAGLTVVLSTAASEVRVTKNFGADTAVELFGYWVGEFQVIATILSLVRNICYSHWCSFVRLKGILGVYG